MTRVKNKQCDELELEEEKEYNKNHGFFNIQREIKGRTKNGQGQYLVFYFYDEADFKEVLKAFEMPGKKSRSHPFLNSDKLLTISRKINENR